MITTRAKKGSELTYEEMDNNLIELQRDMIGRLYNIEPTIVNRSSSQSIPKVDTPTEGENIDIFDLNLADKTKTLIAYGSLSSRGSQVGVYREITVVLKYNESESKWSEEDGDYDYYVNFDPDYGINEEKQTFCIVRVLPDTEYFIDFKLYEIG